MSLCNCLATSFSLIESRKHGSCTATAHTWCVVRPPEVARSCQLPQSTYLDCRQKFIARLVDVVRHAIHQLCRHQRSDIEVNRSSHGMLPLDVDDLPLPLLVGTERAMSLTGCMLRSLAQTKGLGVHAEQTNSGHRIFILSKHTKSRLEHRHPPAKQCRGRQRTYELSKHPTIDQLLQGSY